MRHIFSCWGEIAARMASSRTIALFLDFDGTLAPIQPRPELVRVHPGVRRTLTALAGSPRLRVWVISARRRADIRARVRVPAAEYLGLYGRERGFLPASGAGHREREGGAGGDSASAAGGVDRRQGAHGGRALPGRAGAGAQHGGGECGSRGGAVAARSADCAGQVRLGGGSARAGATKGPRCCASLPGCATGRCRCTWATISPTRLRLRRCLGEWGFAWAAWVRRAQGTGWRDRSRSTIFWKS